MIIINYYNINEVTEIIYHYHNIKRKNHLVKNPKFDLF